MASSLRSVEDQLPALVQLSMGQAGMLQIVFQFSQAITAVAAGRAIGDDQSLAFEAPKSGQTDAQEACRFARRQQTCTLRVIHAMV